jgi:TetR/AcrR family transcriptional regulator, cholesterol catabolism regulator
METLHTKFVSLVYKCNFTTMSRTEILERAKELFMQYGIKSITMDDLAREMGISKKTLYQHVENKTDLIERIIHQHIHDEKKCLSEIPEKARDAIEQVLMIAHHVIQILRSMRPTTMFDLKKYYHDCWNMMDEFQEKYMYKMIRNNIEQGVEEGLYRDNLDSDIVAKLYVGKTMLLTDEKLFPMREYDRDKLFTEYIQYHLRGIVSEKGMEQLKTYQPEYV